MARLHVLSLGLHGHINPTLPLVRELTQRGDEVTYHAPEPFRSVIEATGCRFLPHQSRFLDGSPYGNPALAPRPMPLRLVDDCLLTVEQLHARLARRRPDAILHDVMCAAGRVLAESLGTRWIRLVPALALNDAFPFEPAFAPEILEAFGRGADELGRRYGVRRFTLRDVFAEPAPLNLVFTSRAFQPRGETFDARYRFVGPSVDRPAEKKESLVYVSLGTLSNARPAFFRACYDALRTGTRAAVIATGDRGGLELETAAEDRVRIVRHAPQLELLSRACVFVTHGGFNSVMEGLHFGVPLVLFPQTEEQRMNARRVVQLGAGVLLDSPERIAAAIEAALGEPAARAAELGRDLRSAGGFRHAADAVQKYVGGKSEHREARDEARPAGQPAP